MDASGKTVFVPYMKVDCGSFIDGDWLVQVGECIQMPSQIRLRRDGIQICYCQTEEQFRESKIKQASCPVLDGGSSRPLIVDEVNDVTFLEVRDG